MFLKRIELAGFKSFADRTELEFVPGITGVVGPNGSGKSNISDGIRWVLGEQSARSLRGGKMEDVIFAGSDSRKAVNFGEVSITLDNADQTLPLDYNEVTVTRRIHRSGESEYFINKQLCRLRDIVELFMDTGIGKEAYSMIGQGRIEEILSTKSEERRAIFEEASGIVKYKARKKETVKKLNDTEQNLLRIHDLISELSDQIEPLREQSEKAIHYKELRELLKRNEIAMYVHQIEQIYETWNDANALLSQLKTEQIELSSIVSQQDAGLEKHRWELKQLEEQLELDHETLLQLSEQFEKCEGLGEVLKERRKNIVQQQEQLQHAIELQETRLSTKELEAVGFNEKLKQVREQLEKFQLELTAEEQQLVGITDGMRSEKEEQLKADLLDKLNQLAQVRNEIRYATQQMETVSRRKDRIEDDKTKWTEQHVELSGKKEALEKTLQQIAEEIEHTRQAYVSVSNEIQAKQALLEESLLSVRKWEQKSDALSSRRDTMKELQNDYDGFIHGVKDVLRAKDRPQGLQGIHGAIAELIKVPVEYETAMETALGGALQHIVVEQEGHAREAIAYLKKRQSGRATFLPLDVVRGRSLSQADQQSIRSADGFVGLAVDLIDFKQQYSQVISSLLGNVVIAKDIEKANHIAARCHYRYRVVTLEGDVVNPGGSMTGGSQRKNTSNLLGRQRVIAQLEKEIEAAETNLLALKNKTNQIKTEIDLHNKNCDELRESGEQKRLQEQQLRSQLNVLEHETKTVKDQLLLCSQDHASLDQEILEHEEKQKQSESLQTQLQKEEEEIQHALKMAEENRKANEFAKDEMQDRLTSLKVSIATASREEQSLLEQGNRFSLELSAQREELQSNRDTLQKLEHDMQHHNEETIEQKEQLNDLQLKKQHCSEGIEYKRAKRMEWSKKIEQEENKTKEERAALKTVEEKLHHTEVKVNRLDVELENLLKKLAEDYELSFELAKERYPIPDDIPATQQLVRDVKRQMSSLGEVNLGAIEEFKRVEERYHFLDDQKNDLMEAKATLYQVIREMEEEMSKRFKTTFEAIRSHFVVVFAKLFGGGRADLILSDPDNLLETGIEIVAQPPGKKLQNLQLLSGGEKALTAIALLFAIIRVKPVPFCVLDEVEAALDEANVTRFAQYLRDFSQETQFIVVTHRKGTMEETDVLYGVTMEEDGVSRLVSVRLQDEDFNADEFEAI